jgi:HEAT repeat protein
MTDEQSFFVEEVDHEIIMHRDVHFNGSFPLMLGYYDSEKKGIQEAFDLERIERLALIEKTSPEPLSTLLLTEENHNAIKQAKKAYEALRKMKDLPPCATQKLAELIFCEEEEPIEAIEELCAYEQEAVNLLIPILKEEDFYNPLFPGYGLAPALAAECLGILQAKEAISPLFEAISRREFFVEEATLQALFKIGAPAKEFLLKALLKMPLSKENENAAIALIAFKDDPAIPKACLRLLEDPEVQKKESLFTYLLLTCDDLTEKEEISRLEALASLPLSPALKEELSWILRSYRKK